MTLRQDNFNALLRDELAAPDWAGEAPPNQKTIIDWFFLTPYMFECLCFLKVNNEMWGGQEVKAAMEAAKTNMKNKREQADYEAHQEDAESSE